MTTQTRTPTSDYAKSGTWSPTSNIYATVDDAPPLSSAGDSDYAVHGTTAGYISFGFTKFTVPAGATINRVSVYTRLRKNAYWLASAATARLVVGGTAYAGSAMTLPIVAANYRYDWTTNPKTSSAWTVDQVNGTGTNTLQYFGLTSSDANPTINLYQTYIEVDYTEAGGSSSTTVCNRPDITVDLDLIADSGIFVLGSSLLGTSGTDVLGSLAHYWAQIPTTDIEQVSIRRGRSREDMSAQPGELVLTLDNASGDYDPDNASSAYIDDDGYTLLSRGLGVRVVATWQGTSYTIWQGRVEQVDCDMGQIPPRTTFRCVEALEWLAGLQVAEIETAAYHGDTTAARVGRILDIVGWSATDRALTGSRTMQPTTLGETALELCEQASRCEFGHFWVSRDGKMTLLPYESLASTTNRFTLSTTASATKIPYDTLKTSPGAAYLSNTVTIQQADEPVKLSQTAENAASVGKYGLFAKTVDAPLLDDAVALAVAQLMANRNALPATRIERIEFQAQCLGDLWDDLLQTELGDRVTVETVTFDGRSRTWTNLIIESLSHDITPVSWRTGLDLSPTVTV